MALKLKLKPGERVFLNGALIRNGSTGAELELLNKVPLLREKDILLESDADTPCKKLYVIVQTMYFDAVEQSSYLRTYEMLAAEIVRAAPSTATYLEAVHAHVVEERYYVALKGLRELIDYEMELMQHAK